MLKKEKLKQNTVALVKTHGNLVNNELVENTQIEINLYLNIRCDMINTSKILQIARLAK
jgi:hypothetical protein